MTYLDSKFDSFAGGSALQASGICPSTGQVRNFEVCPTDLSGQVPAGIPEYAVTVGGTYSVPIGENELVFHTDYQLESATQVAQGVPGIRRAVEALNASISFQMANGISVTAWGRNLTDATYTTTIFPSVAQSGSLSGYRNQPKTYGGSIKFKF